MELLSDNGITKTFKQEDVDIFFSKAFDEESNVHFCVISIPEIKQLSVQGIQFPFAFDSEADRDSYFLNLDCTIMSQLMSNLINQIEINLSELHRN